MVLNILAVGTRYISVRRHAPTSGQQGGPAGRVSVPLRFRLLRGAVQQRGAAADPPGSQERTHRGRHSSFRFSWGWKIVTRSFFQVVRCLCLAGGKCDVKNRDGCTPEAAAIANGHSDVCQLIERLKKESFSRKPLS